MTQIKNQLMKEYGARRTQMDFQLRETESGEACERLMGTSIWQEALHVMVYLSMREELDTRAWVQYLLLETEKKVYVPFIENKEIGIQVAELTDFSHVSSGMYGILEPRVQYRKPIDPKILELIIVPGIVFDRRGGRIGYGHGYYDRFLKLTHAQKIGLAFECQVLQEIPQNPHDVAMDMLVTAHEVISVPE